MSDAMYEFSLDQGQRLCLHGEVCKWRHTQRTGSLVVFVSDEPMYALPNSANFACDVTARGFGVELRLGGFDSQAVVQWASKVTIAKYVCIC